MSLPVYLALTGAEFPHRPDHYQNLAYMACHFSPYGTGLSNTPRHLPPGCLLILNDRIPLFRHDPERITGELREAVETSECNGVLLDFQREKTPLQEQIAQAIVGALPCPVAVTEGYCNRLDCPVFLCPPLYATPEETLAKWDGREIWLDLGLWQQTLTLTEAGCDIGATLPVAELEDSFFSEELCCSYRVEVLEDRAVFTLQREGTHLQMLLDRCQDPPVTRAVGLYQEIGQYFVDSI